jgi:hypothetical protein
MVKLLRFPLRVKEEEVLNVPVIGIGSWLGFVPPLGSKFPVKPLFELTVPLNPTG